MKILSNKLITTKIIYQLSLKTWKYAKLSSSLLEKSPKSLPQTENFCYESSHKSILEHIFFGLSHETALEMSQPLWCPLFAAVRRVSPEKIIFPFLGTAQFLV